MTTGPEKAWSIGSGESRNHQDGQVEKSITEVLAGVEPNARSRKASHHLGVFKQGLPEEKTKRRDTRTGTQLRESPAEKRSVSGEHATLGDGQTSPQPTESVVRRNPIPHRVRTSALQSPTAPPISEAPEDYFLLRTDSSAKTAVQSELAARVKPSDADNQRTEGAESNVPQDHLEDYDADARRKSGDSTEAGEGAEDADDSSEEKISSAVFVPHQGLEEPAEIAGYDSGAPPRLPAGSRTLSCSDDFHPWLVKADEPEVDEQVDHDHDNDGPISLARETTITGPASEAPSRISDAAAFVDEPEVVKHSVRPASTFPQSHDEHVHEHQLAPKQPLDAIELIPYKHQVGGHTTLWRFSKRAVCKQLNNRENEFYERIERYHRDLLPFLPR
jgi:hypothetical protein